MRVGLRGCRRAPQPMATFSGSGNKVRYFFASSRSPSIRIVSSGAPPWITPATALGGQIMRMPDELGQVKAGFLADIILIDGDPLEAITILQDRERIVGIMKDGVSHK